MKEAEVEEVKDETERLNMEMKSKEESYQILLKESKEEITAMRNALEEREEELRVLKVEMGDLVKKVEDTKEQREELKSRERKLEEDLLSEKAKNSVLNDRLLDKENERFE